MVKIVKGMTYSYHVLTFVVGASSLPTVSGTIAGCTTIVTEGTQSGTSGYYVYLSGTPTTMGTVTLTLAYKYSGTNVSAPLEVVVSGIVVVYENVGNAGLTLVKGPYGKGESFTLWDAGTATGKSCTGWYTAASGGVKIGDPGATYTLTAAQVNTAISNNYEIHFYAQWGTASYTVTYNSNGGSTTPSAATVTYGQSVTLPTVANSSGAKLKGWFTSAVGGTKVGDAGSTYAPSSNITLYAQWIDSLLEKMVPISFDEVLSRMESIAKEFQESMQNSMTEKGISYTMENGDIKTYTIPAQTFSGSVGVTYPGAANHTGNSAHTETYSVTVTIPASTHTNVDTELSPTAVINQIRTKFKTDKVHQPVTQASMSAIFLAFATSLSWMVQKHMLTSTLGTLAVNETTTIKAFHNSAINIAKDIQFGVTPATVSEWTDAMMEIALTEPNNYLTLARVSTEYANATASWSSSSCSSSSSSSCCSSSSSSSCSSSSCSCFFVVFYNLGGI
jgi:hypothetical protein